MQERYWNMPASHDRRSEHVYEESDEQGLLIFSSTLRLVYSDQQAWKLCNLLNQLEQGKPAKGIIPAKIFEACHSIIDVLQSGFSVKDGEPLQVKVILGNRQQQVLVLAIALPDSHDRSQSRILVILEEAKSQSRLLLRVAQQRFSLSAKETLVVQHLLKGWTNKEIANEMRISEQTVKENIKNIMKKTATMTRTGIVTAIAGFTQKPLEK
jgi:DNA-binding CsgD family transcriptional regulator